MPSRMDSARARARTVIVRWIGSSLPFFLPPLIGHAQKQILTSITCYNTEWVSAKRLGSTCHVAVSQPSGRSDAQTLVGALVGLTGARAA